jgi:DNA primase
MLKEQITRKLFSYFIVQQGFNKYHKGWLRGDCPDCGKHNKFGIQLAQERTNCFVCGYREKPIYVLMKYEGLDDVQQAKIFLKAFDKDTVERFDEVIEEPERVKQKNIKLPQAFKLLSFGNSEIAKMARNYMRGRGFNILNLVFQGVGYCDDGPLNGYIIFPIIDKGSLIYYQSRCFLGFGPKFNNPEESELGIGKTQIIYNREALYVHKKVYIVESIINALTMGVRGVGTLGKSLSAYQVNEIIKSPCEEVILALDPDAISNTIELAFKLINHKRVKIIFFPLEQDVNSMGKQYVRAREKEAEYLSFGQLLSLKDDL